MKSLALLLPCLLATFTLAHQQHNVRRPFSHHARALGIKPTGAANGTTAAGTVAHPAAQPNGTNSTTPLDSPASSKNGTLSTPKVSGNGTSLRGSSGSNTTLNTTTTTTSSTAAGIVPVTSPTGATLPNSKPISGDGGWTAAVAKAKAFVSKLTIDEKVNLTTGVDTIGRCVGNTGRVTRLNFDGFCFEDSPVGVRDTDYASVFPSAVNVATTWDKNLMLKRGTAMGAEFRGKGVNVALGPMMNLARDVAAGRNWEGGGADPFLSGVHASQNIQGIQSQGVIACAKHYALNEQEHFRGGSGSEAYSSNIDDRTFHEDQLWPFAESVKAGVGSVMCAYNRVNQTSACENRRLLNDILKEELDFQGFVLSDWAAVVSLYPSVMNGADVNMPGFVAYGDPDEGNPAAANNSYWGLQLGNAVKNGTIPESRFDDMVTRLMAAYYQFGQDKGFPAVNFDYTTEETSVNGTIVNEHVNVQGDHYKLIREIGGASTILLKNTKQTLPINLSKVKNLAILGSDAGPNPDGPNSCSDRGCDQGTLALGWGSGTANFPYLVTPYEAIQTYVHSKQPDTIIQSVFDDFDYAAVNQTASQADTCMVFANADSGEGYITVDTNAGDRNNLTLWHGGDDLILITASQCANTIVVLHTVGAVLVEPWYDHPNVTAILYAGLPGQESGNALLDVLIGTVNPSGRLPYTIAKNRSDYPSDILYTVSNTSSDYIPQIDYTEKLNIDYRHFDSANIEPRYEFGFGMSYTNFSYSGLSVKMLATASSLASDQGSTQPGGITSLYADAVTVSFTVKNTGAYDGNEVAQLYLGFPASAHEPPRVLRGFERQLIKKGQSAKFSISLRVKDISIWDTPSQAWVIPDGKFTIYIGSSSRQLHLTKTFSL
ncbi:glycoside hydrolase family 3 protein [Piloderma croceum F 1598]|uniref:beta-glucosidase n=1 Tax=Piloderma croceum (strain F 1598) TaxID=765440 RepID=A0A0C3FGQ2_PILCF|nr:glycoside hydrolase family 3 protein [Piloderma croceum F 1598]